MSYKQMEKEELLDLVKKLSDQIEDLSKKLSDLIITDEITNLFNRKALDKILEYEVNRAERSQSHLCVLLLGIVDFQQIKNKYGLEISNIILIQIARIIRMSIRNIDIVGRYSEDVFMIILPDLNPNKGYVVEDRIQRHIDKEIFPGILSITLCKGLKHYDGEPLHKLIETAERNLYLNKKEYEL